MISVQQLHVGYNTNTLFYVDQCTATKGELIALIGKNGTGKSTLLRMLMGLKPVSQGTILLNQIPLSHYSIKSRASVISFVSTDNVKVGYLTVENLVSLGLSTNIHSLPTDLEQLQIGEILQHVGLSGYQSRYVNELSDGERQSTMVARAIAQNTPIILLDEPTAHLDISNKHQLISHLHNLTQTLEKTIIFSSHDLNIVETFAHSLWAVDNGILVHGTFAELKTKGVIDRICNY